MEADDPTVLAWAARERRVLMTHDINTIPHFAYQRVAAGASMPGIFEVRDSIPIGQAIEDLLCLAECSRDGEWEGQVIFLPL